MNVDANSIFASMLVSSIGFVSFAYGKKQSRLPQMAIGLVMMGYPYFVTSVPLMLAIGGGLLALLTILVKIGL
ncbi:MAG: hypothetical protein ABJE95_17100 [Byssovorax sp.]